MQVLEGEKVVLEGQGGSRGPNLILTTHRVRLEQRSRSATLLRSIMLDQVAFVGLVTKQHPVLILFAVLVLLVFLQAGSLQMGMLVAALLLVLYLVMRSAVLTVVSSSGEAIEVAVRGMAPAQVEAFVEAVERQRWAYLAFAGRRAA